MLIDYNKITRLNVYRKLRNTHYQWYNKKKLFGFIPYIQGGFYKWGVRGQYHVKNENIISDRLYIEDKHVYYYPHMDIVLSDGSEHTKYFRTVEELIEETNKQEYTHLLLWK